ncbi:NAD-dependent epimerase/dehydratase family protein [Paractinoplanes hotanensis]|uniref:NAD-dependent epimerase/dehydratase family protein n=1 Tax=Paractinoplanes hotanensis TaxID=2906497 RepID=A0ABT0YA59_9ACTN|nr:NAD-dependent epimerase/dehydratase family protein [Actinoplanes hotanensis]MCM4082174.1 NAD-dependent epimerase/dehydratase family protein [Actinoplanes hotanensis]
MHIFVTGGAGFIGSAHVHALLQDDVAGTSVAVLDGLSCSGNRDNLPQTHPRLRLVRGGITDEAA